jgi:mono/diheme cytochrome c family protein
MGFSPADAAVLDRGEGIYRMLCFACHGANGEGAPKQGASPGTTMAPPLIHAKLVSDPPDAIISVILKGLKGPVSGKTYSEQMVAMEGNDNAYIAAVASYVRNSFSNSASLVKVSDVARVREAETAHNSSWTVEELEACIPQPLGNREQWKVSASEATDLAPLAVDGDAKTAYDSGAAQQPGMWYQVELPQETTLSGLSLDTGNSTRTFPQAFKIELSNDGTNWGEPLVTDHGTSRLTQAAFPPAKAKFVRISLTQPPAGGRGQGRRGGPGRGGPGAPAHWAISELTLYTPGSPIMATAKDVNKYE